MPITFAVPEVGLRMVQRIMSRVVFPDPFGPRITIISPSSTVKFSSRRASVFPYLFERLRVSTANKDECKTQEVSDKNVRRKSNLAVSLLKKTISVEWITYVLY